VERTRTIELTDWRAFLDQAVRLKTGAGDSPPSTDGFLSDHIFRGQPDAAWDLETTLERYLKRDNISVFAYYEVLKAVALRVESATGRRWKLPSSAAYAADWRAGKGFPRGAFPAYEFMAYTRHHGFPSPLLDWTHSPYIAAYFAYAFATPPPSGKVAIYAYREHAGSTKITQGGTPQIRELGPYVRTHSRHFLQQSQYTVCWQRTEEGLVYRGHDSVFLQERRRQDLLLKYELPAAEANAVLSELDLSNVNAYSLFGSDESLLHTLAFRELRDFNES
jgi:hypothetical protein